MHTQETTDTAGATLPTEGTTETDLTAKAELDAELDAQLEEDLANKKAEQDAELLADAQKTEEKTDETKNLATDANHAEGDIFSALDALDLDEESKSYVTNQKIFHKHASEAGKKNIEKVLADKFLSK